MNKKDSDIRGISTVITITEYDIILGILLLRYDRYCILRDCNIIFP